MSTPPPTPPHPKTCTCSTIYASTLTASLSNDGDRRLDPHSSISVILVNHPPQQQHITREKTAYRISKLYSDTPQPKRRKRTRQLRCCVPNQVSAHFGAILMILLQGGYARALALCWQWTFALGCTQFVDVTHPTRYSPRVCSDYCFQLFLVISIKPS